MSGNGMQGRGKKIVNGFRVWEEIRDWRLDGFEFGYKV
jgi:hypothetical protein